MKIKNIDATDAVMKTVEFLETTIQSLRGQAEEELLKAKETAHRNRVQANKLEKIKQQLTQSLDQEKISEVLAVRSWEVKSLSEQAVIDG